MKLIVEEQQYTRIVQKLTEFTSNRSLLVAHKSGIGSIFPKAAMMANPLRFRSNELEKAGAEAADDTEAEDFYVEDNSDPQL